MQMNRNNLNKRQQTAYARTCNQVRKRFGSYHSIALRIFAISDEEVTGETVRSWFLSQKIPTDYCFVLYQMMDREIDLFALVPWIAEFVELKGDPGASN